MNGLSQMHKQSILFVINSLEGGGAEKVLVNLLEHIRPEIEKKQSQVFLYLLDDYEKKHDVPDYVVVTVGSAQGSIAKSIVQLSKEVRRQKPDVIVSFLTRSNCASVLAGKLTGTKVIINERVNTSSHFSRGLAAAVNKLMVKALYPVADKICAVSQGVAHDLVENYRVPKNKLITIPNAYDVNQLREKAGVNPENLPDRPYVCAVGRLTSNKNFPMLIEALSLVEEPVDLVIIGQGEEADNLKRLCANYQLEERVHFLGFQSNPHPYIAYALFYVSSSNAEGFPNALAEAMALGKAVISTNCESGPAEILADCPSIDIDDVVTSTYGLLTPVNQAKAMAKAMSMFMDVELRAHYQTQSVRRIQDYSYPAFISKYLNTISVV